MGGSVGEWMSGRPEWDGVLSRCSMCHGWIWGGGHGYWGDMDMGWGHGGAWEGEREVLEVHAHVWMWVHRCLYTYIPRA